MFESKSPAKSKGMTDLELLAIVDAQEKRSLGYGDGELSKQRSEAIKRYNGELYGDEVVGQSSVLTSEVFDTVEWILPSLLRIFTASDKAVEFAPETPEDEKGAKQSTLAANYVFYRQNPGFTILYSFFKDALIEKNGYVEVYYDKSERTKKESYQGLSQGQLTQLVSTPGVELLEADEYPDPSFQQQPDPMAAGVGMAMQTPIQPPMLYDCKISVTEPYGKVCIENIAPEEMLVDVAHKDVDLQNCNFSARRFQRTISDLDAAGYDTTKIVLTSSDDDGVETSDEFLTRKQYDEERLYEDDNTTDRSMRKVWVTKAFIRVDYDGDGKAELRRIVRVGKVILENEETDVVPFACLTPIIQTHRHIGKSVAEIVLELQKIGTAVTRQTLNNLYLTNMPRMLVQSDTNGAPLANLDDLLTVRVGGVVRHWGTRDPAPLTVPFMGQHGIQMLEYLNTVKENRTGVTRYNQGVDADSLNKTASGISQIMNASQQRIELIARIFAETGVKQLFRLIQHCLMTYQNKSMMLQLTDGFEEIDPREWSDSYDMVINVGLGTGDKNQQLEHLKAIAEAQFQLIQTQMGVVTPKNIYTTQTKIAENAGFKNVEDFWTDPAPEGEDGQPVPQEQPPERPDPAMVEAQGKLQLEQQKMQMQGQMEAQKAQQTAQMEQVKLQAQQQGEAMKMQAAQAQAQAKLQMEREHMTASVALEQWKAQQEAELAVFKAKLDADTKLQIAAMQPKPEARPSA
jgi:hypothetical protein